MPTIPNEKKALVDLDHELLVELRRPRKTKTSWTPTPQESLSKKNLHSDHELERSCRCASQDTRRPICCCRGDRGTVPIRPCPLQWKPQTWRDYKKVVHITNRTLIQQLTWKRTYKISQALWMIQGERQ